MWWGARAYPNIYKWNQPTIVYLFRILKGRMLGMVFSHACITRMHTKNEGRELYKCDVTQYKFLSLLPNLKTQNISISNVRTTIPRNSRLSSTL